MGDAVRVLTHSRVINGAFTSKEVLARDAVWASVDAFFERVENLRLRRPW